MACDACDLYPWIKIVHDNEAPEPAPRRRPMRAETVEDTPSPRRAHPTRTATKPEGRA